VAHSNLSSSLISGGSTEDEVDSVLFGNDLVTQAKMESKLVPSVVMKCIEAVEEQGTVFFDMHVLSTFRLVLMVLILCAFMLDV
jgi:hypothetical protein